MDEPFTGLDLKWRRSVLSKIRELKTAGKSIVLATHLVEEGYELADRIAFLNKGKLMFIRDKQDIQLKEIQELFHSLGEAA
jgi:ABC-type multidrug transport system ATPase subunit